MKKFAFYLILMLTSQIALAQHHHHHQDPSSVHGMLLFGKKKVFLSHLPMFHNPHDYQTIFEVELDNESSAIYQNLTTTQDAKNIFTIVPEPFVLPEKVLNPTPFKFALYMGHFERGGIKVVDGTVTIKKVLYHQKLNPLGHAPNAFQAILIGDSEEAFVLHKINKRPDFDQVAEINADTINFPTPALVHLKNKINEEPLNMGEELFFQSPLPRGTVNTLEITEVLYTEFNDLSF